MGSNDAVDRPGLGVRAGWVLNWYPGAGEGGGCFRPAAPVPHGFRSGPAVDPERARAEAARRARGRLRRYCAANRLNRLGTLTYEGSGCHDPRRVRADVGVFFRRLRDALGGDPFPYVWVPEWHKTDHGLHVHFAVGRFVPRGRIKAAWGAVEGGGFVHIKLLGDLPVGSGKLAEARLAAGYLSKYVSKTFVESEDRRPKGLHRFDVAEGFSPEVVKLWGVSEADVIRQASDLAGSWPVQHWASRDSESWQGPPAVWVQWAG